MLLSEKSYLNKKGKQIALISIFLIFGLIYSSISLVNHYLFRTYALDLGMFNQAIFDFSLLRNNYFSLNILPVDINYFGDHFSPITVLLSPLRYLFGTYTLLIIQIAAILFGGLGIYKYVSENTKYRFLPLILLIQFFGAWGIYSALSYDYHNNVLAAMFLPWFIYFFEKNNKKYILLFFFLMLITKENIALWMFFIIAGLLIKDRFRSFKKEPVFILFLLLFSVVYFIGVVTYIMPALNEGQGMNQLARYPALGQNLTEMFTTIFTQPFYTFSLLYESTLVGEIYANIKNELHFMVFVSGGVALLFAPHYLVMLLPVYAQKLFSDNYGLWGINAQYSIEFAPVLSLALFDLSNRFTKPFYAYAIALLFTFSTFYFNYKKMENRNSLWYDPVQTKFYDRSHYEAEFDIKEIYKALKLIPDDAAVSVHSAISPHLAFRKKIYHFPITRDAEYIAVFIHDRKGYYPLSKEDYLQTIQQLQTDEGFVKIYDKNDLLILKKTSFNP